MIVKANVVDKETGMRTDAYFLVRFDHTPIKGVKKHHRRTGLCSIYYLSNEKSLKDAVGKNIDGQFFASRICGEKYKYFICDQSISCKSFAVMTPVRANTAIGSIAVVFAFMPKS